MPARFARRLRRKFFLIFVKIFLSFGSRFLIIFLQFQSISGAKFSYLVFSYRVSGVYCCGANLYTNEIAEIVVAPQDPCFFGNSTSDKSWGA